MTNDINTLNGALSELGELLSDNINSKSECLDTSPNDGLTTLANKVKDIPSSKKIMGRLDCWEYGSNITCNIVNDEYWSFTNSSSTQDITSNSWIYIKGSDYANSNDKVIVSFKMGAIPSTTSKFAWSLVDNEGNLFNSAYFIENTHLINSTRYDESSLSFDNDDVLTFIIYQNVIYLYLNEYCKAYSEISSAYSDKPFKLILMCGKNTFVNNIKEVSYEIINGCFEDIYYIRKYTTSTKDSFKFLKNNEIVIGEIVSIKKNGVEFEMETDGYGFVSFDDLVSDDIIEIEYEDIKYWFKKA